MSALRAKVLLRCLAVAGVLFGLTPAAAHAAGSVWIGGPEGAAAGLFGNYFIDAKGHVWVGFGVSGAAPGSAQHATLDLSHLRTSRVGVSADDQDCQLSATEVTCSGAADANGRFSAQARLDTQSGAVLGDAGTLLARSGGQSTARIGVFVTNAAGADLEVTTSTPPSGQVGDTVSVDVTVVNHGPNTEPYWGLGAIHGPDYATFLGATGCASATLAGVQAACAHTDPQAPGAAVKVSLRFRLDKARTGGTGGFQLLEYLDDTNHANEHLSFPLRVLGAPSTSPSPSAAASAAILAPAVIAATTPAAAQVAAKDIKFSSTRRVAHEGLWVNAGLAGAILLGSCLFVLVSRLRQRFATGS